MYCNFICSLSDVIIKTFSHSVSQSLAPYQRVINAAVRLVDALRLRDHVTSAAIDLDWLPAAEARIQYKLYTMLSLGEHQHMLRIFFNLSPPCLHVIRFYGQQLLSLFIVPRTRLLFGQRAFRVAAPRRGNRLPHDVRCAGNTNTLKNSNLFIHKILFC